MFRLKFLSLIFILPLLEACGDGSKGEKEVAGPAGPPGPPMSGTMWRSAIVTCTCAAELRNVVQLVHVMAVTVLPDEHATMLRHGPRPIAGPTVERYDADRSAIQDDPSTNLWIYKDGTCRRPAEP